MKKQLDDMIGKVVCFANQTYCLQIMATLTVNKDCNKPVYTAQIHQNNKIVASVTFFEDDVLKVNQEKGNAYIILK